MALVSVTLTLDSSIVQSDEEKFCEDNGTRLCLYIKLYASQVHLPCSNIVIIFLSILIFTFADLGGGGNTAIDCTLISSVNKGFYFAEPIVNHG